MSNDIDERMNSAIALSGLLELKNEKSGNDNVISCKACAYGRLEHQRVSYKNLG